MIDFPDFQYVAEEMNSLEESLLQLAKCHIQDKPLFVISAGITANCEEGNVWKDLQKNLLTKSNKSKQMVADKSDHMIHHQQPPVIVDALKEMVNSY